MDKKIGQKLLKEQLDILEAASKVLKESYDRVVPVLKAIKEELSVAERESCEAVTARFARLCDYLFNRAFRTLDQIELVEEGTNIDRLNRMEKRGVISSAQLWRDLRELRNEIAHEYLIERSDKVLQDVMKHAPELLQTVERFKKYIKSKKY
jgi:uncharacterized protein YutE (UPF0331/DUF86 family)